MKVQLIREFGTPDVFEAADIDTPSPGAGQVLVRQIASSVNPVDTKLRAAGPPIAPELPGVLGCDVAGVVEAVGEGVTRLKKGDAVYGCAGGLRGRGGAYGEYIVVDAAFMAFKPEALDWRETAALPLVTITAWEAMVDRTRVMPGDHVLIHGGAGGVGHIAIQLAKAFDLKVITTAGSEEKCKAAKDLGADLAINYKTEDFVEKVNDFTAGKGADVILDMVSGDYVQRNLDCLAIDGRHVTIAALGGAKAEINMAKLMSKRQTMTGSTLRPRSDEFKALLGDEIRTHAWPLFEDRTVAPVMDETFDLTDVAAAHARMEEGDHIGKIVLRVRDID